MLWIQKSGGLIFLFLATILSVVFSIRYVNELLKGLDPYRAGNNNARPNSQSTQSPTTSASASQELPSLGSGGDPRFSPLAHQPSDTAEVVTPATSTPTISPSNRKKVVDIDREMARMDGDDSSSEGGGDDEDGKNDDGSDDDGDLFGQSGDGIKLDIQVDLDRATAAQPAQLPSAPKLAGEKSKSGVKRRRSSTGSTSSGGGTRRRSKILSTNSLSELWNQVSSLQQGFDHSTALLADITSPDYINVDPSELESLVGDELMQSFKQVQLYEKRVVEQRRELHRIAQKRKGLEQEAVRYLPWLEGTLKQDDEDIEFCKKLEAQIRLFQGVHSQARAARDERLQEEMKRQRDKEELDRKKKEEEERKKFMESAMKKETEAKPGMVWNKALGEYVYLQTDESWRD